MKMIKASILAFAVVICGSPSNAETPDEWIALGARVHGAFGAFIPLGIKIGLDAVKRLNAKPRELTVLYYDNDSSPCACFADGIAIATYASVGQRYHLRKHPQAMPQLLLFGRARVDLASSTRFQWLPLPNSGR